MSQFLQTGSRILLPLALGLIAATAVHAPASAAPTVLVPWQTSGNGTIKNDDFGSVPGLDVLYRSRSGFGDSAEDERVYVWALWGPISFVSFPGGSVGSLFLRPDTGSVDGATLFSFQLGTFGGTAGPNTEVRVYNGDFTSLMFQQSFATGNFAINVEPNVSSLNGLHLQFSNTPQQIGITNISLEGANIFPPPTGGAVPEPDSWVMLVAGFGLMGAVMRRRARQQPRRVLA